MYINMNNQNFKQAKNVQNISNSQSCNRSLYDSKWMVEENQEQEEIQQASIFKDLSRKMYSQKPSNISKQYSVHPKYDAALPPKPTQIPQSWSSISPSPRLLFTNNELHKINPNSDMITSNNDSNIHLLDLHNLKSDAFTSQINESVDNLQPLNSTSSFVRHRKTQMSLRKAFGIFDDIPRTDEHVNILPKDEKIMINRTVTPLLPFDEFPKNIRQPNIVNSSNTLSSSSYLNEPLKTSSKITMEKLDSNSKGRPNVGERSGNGTGFSTSEDNDEYSQQLRNQFKKLTTQSSFSKRLLSPSIPSSETGQLFQPNFLPSNSSHDLSNNYSIDSNFQTHLNRSSTFQQNLSTSRSSEGSRSSLSLNTTQKSVDNFTSPTVSNSSGNSLDRRLLNENSTKQISFTPLANISIRNSMDNINLCSSNNFGYSDVSTAKNSRHRWSLSMDKDDDNIQNKNSVFDIKYAKNCRTNRLGYTGGRNEQNINSQDNLKNKKLLRPDKKESNSDRTENLTSINGTTGCDESSISMYNYESVQGANNFGADVNYVKNLHYENIYKSPEYNNMVVDHNRPNFQSDIYHTSENIKNSMTSFPDLQSNDSQCNLSPQSSMNLNVNKLKNIMRQEIFTRDNQMDICFRVNSSNNIVSIEKEFTHNNFSKPSKKLDDSNSTEYPSNQSDYKNKTIIDATRFYDEIIASDYNVAHKLVPDYNAEDYKEQEKLEGDPIVLKPPKKIKKKKVPTATLR